LLQDFLTINTTVYTLFLQVKEQNRLAREAHKQAAEAHRAAAVENRRRLALAEEQQAAAAAQLVADNAAALQQARHDYKVTGRCLFALNLAAPLLRYVARNHLFAK
jgi:hypothetical protein